MKVHDVDEDGNFWFVSGVTDHYHARVEVIRHLQEELANDPLTFESAVALVLDAKAEEANFVVSDRPQGNLYAEAPSRINPHTAWESGVDWIGFGVALGFKVPSWSSREDEDK